LRAGAGAARDRRRALSKAEDVGDGAAGGGAAGGGGDAAGAVTAERQVHAAAATVAGEDEVQVVVNAEDVEARLQAAEVGVVNPHRRADDRRGHPEVVVRADDRGLEPVAAGAQGNGAEGRFRLDLSAAEPRAAGRGFGQAAVQQRRNLGAGLAAVVGTEQNLEARARPGREAVPQVQPADAGDVPGLA